MIIKFYDKQFLSFPMNSLSHFTGLDQSLSLQSYHLVIVQVVHRRRNHHHTDHNLILLAANHNHVLSDRPRHHHHRPHHRHHHHHQVTSPLERRPLQRSASQESTASEKDFSKAYQVGGGFVRTWFSFITIIIMIIVIIIIIIKAYHVAGGRSEHLAFCIFVFFVFRRSPIVWSIASHRRLCTVGFLSELLNATRPC